MALNYRKRVRIAPGVHVNLSKSGASLSGKVGPVSANTRGRVGVGAAGLRYETNLKSGKSKPTPQQAPVAGTGNAPIVLLIIGLILAPIGLLSFVVAVGLGGPWLIFLLLLVLGVALIMIWITQRRTIDVQAIPRVPLAYDGPLDVVGETHRTAGIAAVHHTIGDAPVLAELIPEPTNTADPNAVQVILTHGRLRYLAGYLPRDIAATVHPIALAHLEAGEIPTAAALIRPFTPAEGGVLYTVTLAQS